MDADKIATGIGDLIKDPLLLLEELDQGFSWLPD